MLPSSSRIFWRHGDCPRPSVGTAFFAWRKDMTGEQLDRLSGLVSRVAELRGYL